MTSIAEHSTTTTTSTSGVRAWVALVQELADLAGITYAAALREAWGTSTADLGRMNYARSHDLPVPKPSKPYQGHRQSPSHVWQGRPAW